MEFLEDFNLIRKWIQITENRIQHVVNEEIVTLYWEIGKYIHEQLNSQKWGQKTVTSLSEFLQESDPGLTGFSPRNLWRMRQFYADYSISEILPPLVAQIGWTHHTILLSRTSSVAEKEFYINLIIKHKYSKRELERQINSHIFQRKIPPSSIVPPLVAQLQNIDSTLLKGIYVLEFLELSNNFCESEFRKEITKNPKKFLLEFGSDLAYIGEEFRIKAMGEEYFIDLLFFHRTLRSLVAFELKIEDFKPEYFGKMAFYLDLLDHHVKNPDEKPSIGIILCPRVNQQVVGHSSAKSSANIHVGRFLTEIPSQKTLLLPDSTPENRFPRLPSPEE